MSGERVEREGRILAKKCCPGNPRWGGHPLLNLTLKSTVPSQGTKGIGSAHGGWSSQAVDNQILTAALVAARSQGRRGPPGDQGSPCPVWKADWPLLGGYS